jgi:hypothetical protein
MHEAIQMEQAEIVTVNPPLNCWGTRREQQALLDQAGERCASSMSDWKGQGHKGRGRLGSRGSGTPSVDSGSGGRGAGSERQIRQERLAGSRIRLGLLNSSVLASASASSRTDWLVNARLDSEQRELEPKLVEAENRAVQRRRSMWLFTDEAPAETGSSGIARVTEQFELRRAQLETATHGQWAALHAPDRKRRRTIWEVRFAACSGVCVTSARQAPFGTIHARAELWKSYLQQLETVASQVARLEARLADLVLPPVSRRSCAARDVA